MKKIAGLFLIIFILGHNRTLLASQESILKNQIEALASQFSSDEVQCAVLIRDLENSQDIYAKDADLPLNPASNTKILTTLAALAGLGPAFQFKTQLLGTGELKSGHLNTLTLKGFGDPTLTTTRLEEMVGQLKAKGITRVEEVIIDDTYFDRDFPGRLEGRQQDAPFNATVGAIALDHNLLEIVVQPGATAKQTAEVQLTPPLPNFPLEGEVNTGGKRSRVIVRHSGKTLEDLTISVNGSIPLHAGPQVYRIAINQPTQLAGFRFLNLLQNHGIQAPFVARIGPSPGKSALLVESLSEPLTAILQEINKKSDNFMAEQVTKVLGTKWGGVPGSTGKGVQAIERMLQALGIQLGEIFLENGSGLSYKNRVKVKTLADTLQKAYEDRRLHQDFISSLSVLGVDGTLRKRFRNTDLAGMFVGKTGTMNGVTALSGYAFRKSAPGKAPFVFAFIANGAGKPFWAQRQWQQKLLEILINQ